MAPKPRKLAPREEIPGWSTMAEGEGGIAGIESSTEPGRGLRRRRAVCMHAVLLARPRMQIPEGYARRKSWSARAPGES